LFQKLKEKWDKPSDKLPGSQCCFNSFTNAFLVFVDFPRVVQNVRCYDEHVKKIDHETEAARELEEKKEEEAKLRASVDTQSNSNTSDNTTTTSDQPKESTSNTTSNQSSAIQQTSSPQDSYSTVDKKDLKAVKESDNTTTTTTSVMSPRERKKSRRTAKNVTNSEESQKMTDSSDTPSSKIRKQSLKELNLKATLSEEQVTVLKESEASESSSSLTPNKDKKQSALSSAVVEAKVESTPAEELASRERSKSSAVKVQKMRDYLYVFGRYSVPLYAFSN
jgi:hypothetical protein